MYANGRDYSASLIRADSRKSRAKDLIFDIKIGAYTLTVGK